MSSRASSNTAAYEHRRKEELQHADNIILYVQYFCYCFPLVVLLLVYNGFTPQYHNMAPQHIIDSHLHVWGDNIEKWPDGDTVIPRELWKVATYDRYYKEARAAGVVGAVLIQPVLPYKFEHDYMLEAMEKYPNFYKGFGLVDPKQGLEQLVTFKQTYKFVGVRFNPGLFGNNNMDVEKGRVLFRQCGEANLVVGFMCFNGMKGSLFEDIKSLIKFSPKTKVVIDHMGFLRQPAHGGLPKDLKNYPLLKDKEKTKQAYHNLFTVDEETFKNVIQLKMLSDNVYIKLSAFFRVSAYPPPFSDLKHKIRKLINVYGPDRLMWGSDFPYAITGGSFGQTESGMSNYADLAHLLHEKMDVTSDPIVMDQIMWKTAADLFQFDLSNVGGEEL